MKSVFVVGMVECPLSQLNFCEVSAEVLTALDLLCIVVQDCILKIADILT